MCGADIAAVVDRVNRGVEPFPGEAELAEKLAAAVGSGRLTATTDTSAAVAASDAVLVAVPRSPSMPTARRTSALSTPRPPTSAAGCIRTPWSATRRRCRGTTRERWKLMLERMSGLCGGVTFSLVYSPERVLTEPIFADLRRYPNIGLANQFARFTADRESMAYQVVEASNPQP